MTPLKRRATNEGFTILEILLAVVILTVGLLGLLAVFPVAMRTGKQAVETTNAGSCETKPSPIVNKV